METEFYSAVNWASPTDHAESLFPWETESPRSGQADVWGSELDLLLSASSYPIPEPPQLQDQEDQQKENNLTALYGGVIVHEEDPSNEAALFQPAPEARTFSAPTPPSNRISKPAEATRKRGRPRKLIDDAGVNAEERRRTQVRIAQRAYRSRKEANISSLQDRIRQLETAIKHMSTSVISFGDDVVRSGALDSHPDLLRPLGNTVQACLALPALPLGESGYQIEDADSTGKKKKKKQIGYATSSTAEGSETMEISEFIDRLHVTCSYQAYLVCANPAVPTRRIERPFRILLSLMPRMFVAELFKDWLLARAGHKTLDHWDHIPFFRIGGAGTHYPSSGNLHFPFPTHGSSAVEEDLSRFAADLQDELEDEWFDLGDLQGYLHERQVVFTASLMPAGPILLGQKEQDPASVSRLMQALVKGAICLGRSPGFRRRNVEKAVDEFIAAQNAS